MSLVIYEIKNLKQARIFLQSEDIKSVVLTNPEGSTKYYGMRVIDYMFTILKKEFPSKVRHITVNASNDYSAYITASQLGYNDIKYECPNAPGNIRY